MYIYGTFIDIHNMTCASFMSVMPSQSVSLFDIQELQDSQLRGLRHRAIGSAPAVRHLPVAGEVSGVFGSMRCSMKCDG